MHNLKHMGKCSASKIFNVTMALLLYILTCEVYTKVVVATYSFGGFTELTEPQHGYSLLLLIVMTLLMPNKTKNTKDIFLLLSFYFLLLPAAVLQAMQGSELSGMLLIAFGILVVPLFYKLAEVVSEKNYSSGSNLIGKKTTTLLPFLFAAIVLFFLAMHVNFQFNLLFSSVYDFRFEFNDSLSFPLNYLLPLAAGPIMSFLAVQFFSRRQWFLLMLALLFSVMFYALSTHKAFLFMPLFAIYLYVLVIREINLFRALAASFAIGGFLALYSEGSLGELVGSVFANRILFIPTQIHYMFLSEFKEIGYLLWAESRISFGLIESPLKISSVNYIAGLMTGDDAIGANVGWIANGYMNMGVGGIILYALLISILLLIIDRLALNYGEMILLSAFGVSIFLLITSSDLLTLLLTGGVLPMLLLLTLVVKISRVKTHI